MTHQIAETARTATDDLAAAQDRATHLAKKADEQIVAALPKSILSAEKMSFDWQEVGTFSGNADSSTVIDQLFDQGPLPAQYIKIVPLQDEKGEPVPVALRVGALVDRDDITYVKGEYAVGAQEQASCWQGGISSSVQAEQRKLAAKEDEAKEQAAREGEREEAEAAEREEADR